MGERPHRTPPLCCITPNPRINNWSDCTTIQCCLPCPRLPARPPPPNHRAHHSRATVLVHRFGCRSRGRGWRPRVVGDHKVRAAAREQHTIHAVHHCLDVRHTVCELWRGRPGGRGALQTLGQRSPTTPTNLDRDHTGPTALNPLHIRCGKLRQARELRKGGAEKATSSDWTANGNPHTPTPGPGWREYWGW